MNESWSNEARVVARAEGGGKRFYWIGGVGGEEGDVEEGEEGEKEEEEKKEKEEEKEEEEEEEEEEKVEKKEMVEEAGRRRRSEEKSVKKRRRDKKTSSKRGRAKRRLSSLVVTLLVASVNGAPTMTVNARRLSSPPKWVNPCGLAAEDFDSDPDVEQLRDVQLLTQVVVQAKTALMHAQLFRDDYIKRTFKVDFADWHLQWKDNHYDWLPSKKDIPKQLGEQLQQQYLDSLELDRSLLDAYEYMQKYAVGLEQIVWDQEDNGLEFRDQFKDTEFKLRTVLCELQVALMERAVTLRPDVTRNAMSTEYRSMSSSATYRDLRDWLIFRDYMNGLEYVVQVFEHLRRGLES